MPAVLCKPDYDPEDDQPEPTPAFDAKLAGPEYWLFARQLDQERLTSFLNELNTQE